MSTAKKNILEPFFELSDHYDRIRSTNQKLTEQRILEVVAQATGQNLSLIRKRWKLIQSMDWTVIDYLERGVIGVNRAMALIENEVELTPEERITIMDNSLNDGVTDAGFKEYLSRYLARRHAEAEAEAE